MKTGIDTEKFDQYISQFPIYEYRILKTEQVSVRERVRTICQTECERYGSTWACPPAVGTLQECEKRIHSYDSAVFFPVWQKYQIFLIWRKCFLPDRSMSVLQSRCLLFLRKKDLQPLLYQQNHAISAIIVPIRKENHAAILIECIHAWKAMA